MSTALLAGFIVTLVSFFLCGLLLILYIRQQTRSRQRAIQHKRQPSMLKNKLYTPTTSTRSPSSTQTCSTATTPDYSQCRPQTAVAKQSVVPSAWRINKGVDTLATIDPARLGNYRRVGGASEPQTDCRNPFRWKRASARCSSDLEHAWPQPLLSPDWTEREDSVEQWLWRSSSNCSSCYSRPSSWYSVADTEGLEKADHERGLDAESQPTEQLKRASALRYKALPPVPIQEGQGNGVNVVKTNWI